MPSEPNAAGNTIVQHNRRAWDSFVEHRHPLTQPANDKQLRDPLRLVDGCGWLGKSIAGKRLLCLASGGGRQSALYAAAGAEVTVVDVSRRMLDLDREVARQRGLQITIVESTMDDLSALPAAGFDIVSQPVSTCYVPIIDKVYREVSRVLVPSGIYISQHKQPSSLQCATRPSEDGYHIDQPYYRSDPLPDVQGSIHRESGALEFLHRWEQLIGGLCRAGFVVEDLIEPQLAQADAAIDSFARRSLYLPPYVRIKARRISAPGSSSDAARVWMPKE